MASEKLPRVLLIGEAANPQWVSVPLVGWSHAEALHRLTGAHLVTHVRNQEAIEAFGWTQGQEFSAIDSEAIARPMWKVDSMIRKITGAGASLSTAFSGVHYYYFEHLVWKKFGDRIRNKEFDLVHRVTPLSPSTPSTLASRCADAGVPFVLGPINGGTPWPKGFRDVLRAEGEWLSYLRGAHRYLPGYRSTRKRSAAIMVASQATLNDMPAEFRPDCVYLPENAIDPKRFSLEQEGPTNKPLTAVFIGRLVACKAVDILIEAAEPLLKAGRLRLRILGDGDEFGKLQAMVQARGLEQAVDMPGWIDHKDLQAELLKCDFLAFPSVRDFGGGVVLEAMALGLVPVVADYGGPAELVTEQTGYRVPLTTRQGFMEAYRKTLAEIVDDPSGLREMGKRARQRVFGQFTWDAKARQVLEVYRWVLGERDKPDFGRPFPDLDPEQCSHTDTAKTDRNAL